MQLSKIKLKASKQNASILKTIIIVTFTRRLTVLQTVKLWNTLIILGTTYIQMKVYILGQEDNSSIIWLVFKIIPFDELVITPIVMSCKSLAFCKIYVANRISFSKPSKFKIVYDLRLDEIHSGTEIEHSQLMDKLELRC